MSNNTKQLLNVLFSQTSTHPMIMNNYQMSGGVQAEHLERQVMYEGRKTTTSTILNCNFCKNLGLPSTGHNVRTCARLASTQCMKCKQYGHTMSRCFNEVLSSPASSSSIQMECKFCKKSGYPSMGHLLKDCQVLKNTTCDKCHQKGHTGSYCNTKIGLEVVDNTKYCTFCKENDGQGHTIKECLKLKHNRCAYCKCLGHIPSYCSKNPDSKFNQKKPTKIEQVFNSVDVSNRDQVIVSFDDDDEEEAKEEIVPQVKSQEEKFMKKINSVSLKNLDEDVDLEISKVVITPQVKPKLNWADMMDDDE